MAQRCILCDEEMTLLEADVPAQEDPDLVCERCRALPATERSRLRTRAVERLLQKTS